MLRKQVPGVSNSMDIKCAVVSSTLVSYPYKPFVFIKTHSR